MIYIYIYESVEGRQDNQQFQSTGTPHSGLSLNSTEAPLMCQ